MYLSKVMLWNFRKYGSNGGFDLSKPDFSLRLKSGMNVLVGENDSGKTAIIDAIKLVLKTQNYEWIKVENDDFYRNAQRCRIELRFDDLKDEEAKNFIEWLGYDTVKNNGNDSKEGSDRVLYLRLILDVKRDVKRDKIYPSEVHAGADDAGYPMTAEAREYLKVTYLKPLRDVKTELAAGKFSRLANILMANEVFANGGVEKEFTDNWKKFSTSVTEFFGDGGKGKAIKRILDEYFKSFCFDGKPTQFSMDELTLKKILQKLELDVGDGINPGLGTLNRLYIAAELLNLHRGNWDGVKLALIEELEAHLHPQAQMRVIEKLEQICEASNDVQFILTTHSPNLASKLKLADLILCQGNKAYPMGSNHTKLDKDEYVFLEKFLDVTKANLFFARGVIFVEGWAEQIFLTAFAKWLKRYKVITKDLTEAGVSIVNVGGIQFLRYSKIFQRENEGEEIDISVAIVTDCDVREYEEMKGGGIQKKDDRAVEKERRDVLAAKHEEFDHEKYIKVFIADKWTFEWALYKSKTLGKAFFDVLKNVHSKTFKDEDTDNDEALAGMLIRHKLDKTDIAYRLADRIDHIECDSKTIKDDHSIQYLVEAVKHVCYQR